MINKKTKAVDLINSQEYHTSEIEELEASLKNVDWSALNHPNSKYTPEQKVMVVSYYVMTGNMSKTARLLNIPNETLRDMRHQTTWWLEIEDAVKASKNEQLEGVMTMVIDMAMEEVLDRIKNGNEVLTKDGTKERVKLTGKELATVFGITFDKRQLLRGASTSIRETKTSSVEDLKDKFAKFSEELKNEKVVSEQ